MLLVWGLQHQGQAFRQGLEKDLTAKDERIWALKRELEIAKKLAEESETARKTLEEQIEKMQKDFEEYSQQRRDEHKKVVVDAQKVVNIYKDLIQSMGKKTEMPRDTLVVDFMD